MRCRVSTAAVDMVVWIGLLVFVDSGGRIVVKVNGGGSYSGR